MTTSVVTATEAMPFRDLAALLYAQDIGAVPVVAPAGQLLGVVSRPDLIPKAAGLAAATGLCPGFGPRRRERRRAMDRTAGELMTAPAVTVAVEGVVGVDERPGFDIDDRYPPAPVAF
jgi:CBS-domain-containing membrane protein